LFAHPRGFSENDIPNARESAAAEAIWRTAKPLTAYSQLTFVEKLMKQISAVMLFLVSIAFNPVFAATAQQEKMAACNKEATGKTGDERKTFMKQCLSAKPKVSEAQQAQRDKMKSCSADAKDMKGAERKQFMSECLKK
jgi:hypothetical protein